jgi:3-hydroxybutyryl-CoA dehydrogenase
MGALHSAARLSLFGHMRTAEQIRTATVLGAGAMGAGIAQVLAQAGLTTRLYDINENAVQKGLAGIEKMLAKGVERGKVSADDMAAALGRLTASADMTACLEGSDLVIEAAPEKLELKKQIFAQVAEVVDAEAIVSSNTSSISIEALAEADPHPQRFLGLHFFNPPPLMPLLEIVHGPKTDAGVIATCKELALQWGKSPIIVKDSPGFASSRLGVGLALEAIRMVEEGVASPADIDTAMELGYRHPMGPLKLTDMIGVDVRVHIAEYLASKLGDERFAPPALMKQMVADGKLGMKSGQGFYKWEGRKPVVD